MAATTQPDDISDPTEWSQTALASLSSVDAALRCQVCKDFYTTPMMTSCAHTFCSLCIRRCLANDGKCPMCRASEQEVKLRRNCALDEVVAAFRAARQKTLLFAVESAAAAAAASAATATDKDDRRASKKRKADTMSAEEEMSASAPSSQQGRKTRSQSRREAGLSTEKPVGLDDVNDDPEGVPTDGLVACPVCGRRMKIDSVYLHLDRCENERDQTYDNNSTTSRSPAPQLRSKHLATQAPVQNLERLPKLSYSLFKENALRKKLAELGIRASGSKSILERRHIEWVNLWNSNCDATHPRPKKELLQDLDLWERSQGSLAPASSGPGSSLMKKDFDGAAWAVGHETDFQRLVAEARRKTAVSAPSTNAAQSAVLDHVQNAAGRDALRTHDDNEAEHDGAGDHVDPVDAQTILSTPSSARVNGSTSLVPVRARDRSSTLLSMDLGLKEPTTAEEDCAARHETKATTPSLQSSIISPTKPHLSCPIPFMFQPSLTTPRMLVDDADDPIMDAVTPVLPESHR